MYIFINLKTKGFDLIQITLKFKLDYINSDLNFKLYPFNDEIKKSNDQMIFLFKINQSILFMNIPNYF